MRLKEIDEIAKSKLKAADVKALEMIKSTQEEAKVLQQTLRQQAEQKQQELLRQLQAAHVRQQEESRQTVLQEAGELVRAFIVKTVELKPEAIDEALIAKAVSAMQQE